MNSALVMAAIVSAVFFPALAQEKEPAIQNRSPGQKSLTAKDFGDLNILSNRGLCLTLTRRIVNGHLVIVREVEHDPGDEYGQVTIRKRVGGKLKVIKRWKHKTEIYEK
jgi:hypothetical protein